MRGVDSETLLAMAETHRELAKRTGDEKRAVLFERAAQQMRDLIARKGDDSAALRRLGQEFQKARFAHLKDMLREACKGHPRYGFYIGWAFLIGAIVALAVLLPSNRGLAFIVCFAMMAIAFALRMWDLKTSIPRMESYIAKILSD